MPVCCRCNGSGRCRNCSCSKAGKPFVNCLPQRKGRCINESLSHDRKSGQTITQGTQPPSSPSATQLFPDNRAPHKVFEQQPGVDNNASNSGMPDLGSNSYEDLQAHVLPEITSLGQSTPDSVSQEPFSRPPSESLSASREWSSPPLHPPDFQWVSHEWEAFCENITATYNEIIHWKQNVFQVPTGATGKAFISELARLFQSYADGSSLESITMKTTTISQILLLQKPSWKSKSKEHVIYLQRRLDLWLKGDIQALLGEGRCIQKYLPTSPRPSDDDVVARTFS